MRQDLRAPGGRHRRSRPLGFGIAVLLGLALITAPAGAVVIDTLTGSGNTAAPGDDPGWANVGLRGIGTGVYLGDGWVITAAHVGGGSIVLSGTSYAMLAGSGTTLTNNRVAGKSAATDLYMFRLASPPPGLPAVALAATAEPSPSGASTPGRPPGPGRRCLRAGTPRDTRRSPADPCGGGPTACWRRACGSTTGSPT
jgi:hypothetical protein